MGLFIKKPLADLMTEANDSGSKSLKRILGPWSLIALGVGVIIGAGLFSITGAVAAGYGVCLSLLYLSLSPPWAVVSPGYVTPSSHP